MSAQIRSVFLVEDDDLTRQSLVRRITAVDPALRVTVAVGNCREIRAALENSRPDVLLVDLGLPDGNGLDIIREAARRWPGVLIMVITVFGDEFIDYTPIDATGTASAWFQVGVRDAVAAQSVWAVCYLPADPVQVDAEAQQSGCEYVMYTSVTQKKGGGFGKFLSVAAPLAGAIPGMGGMGGDGLALNGS